MILRATAPRPTPLADPSVSWSALCPHGAWTTWHQVMFEVPQPGCETAACSGVSSGGSGSLGGQLHIDEAPTGRQSDGASDQPTRRNERTS